MAETSPADAMADVVLTTWRDFMADPESSWEVFPGLVLDALAAPKNRAVFAAWVVTAGIFERDDDAVYVSDYDNWTDPPHELFRVVGAAPEPHEPTTRYWTPGNVAGAPPPAGDLAGQLARAHCVTTARYGAGWEPCGRCVPCQTARVLRAQDEALAAAEAEHEIDKRRIKALIAGGAAGAAPEPQHKPALCRLCGDPILVGHKFGSDAAGWEHLPTCVGTPVCETCKGTRRVRTMTDWLAGRIDGRPCPACAGAAHRAEGS